MKFDLTFTKKNLFISVKFFLAAISFAFLLSGCKTSEIQENERLHPLALLSEDSSIYLNVPSSNQVPLVAEILCDRINRLTYEDAELVAKRINNLYIGLGTVKDRSRLEVSADVDIPPLAVKKVLSKKNGWKNKNILLEKTNLESPYENSFTVFYRDDSDLKISFPEQKTFLLAEEINPSLQKYADGAELCSNFQNDYLSQKSTDILFYITRPGQYLRNLIGIESRGIDFVYGSLSYMPNRKKLNEYSGLYELKLKLHLADKRTMAVFKNLLSVSIGMMGAKIDQTDEQTLELSQIEVSKNQIKKLLSREAISGKHFRVDGEKIIQENKK